MTTARLSASQPIVFEDGTMQYHFRDFQIRVDTIIASAGTTAEWGGLTGTLSAQTDLQSAINAAALTATWGSVAGTLSDQTDLQAALDLKTATTDMDTLAELNTIVTDATLDDASDPRTPTDHDTAKVTTGTFADARISESSVTQHQAALTITESQISDLHAAGVMAFRDDASTTYTLVIGDANKVIRFTGASPAVTIPVEASVNYAVGTVIGMRQAGTGTLVLTTTGLTINGAAPAWAQHSEIQFRKVGSDAWDVM